MQNNIPTLIKHWNDKNPYLRRKTINQLSIDTELSFQAVQRLLKPNKTFYNRLASGKKFKCFEKYEKLAKALDCEFNDLFKTS